MRGRCGILGHSGDPISCAIEAADLEIAMTHQRIEMNPDIMAGKPVIRGTRVPVEMVLRKLGTGMTVEAIIADHPRLTRDDILAAQAFAADYLADEELVHG
jgi:uncharacterized protein (DUF433 family)